MQRTVVFIAPAPGRQVNPKHFIGYTPGGEGGGVCYEAFADFYRHEQFQNAACLPLVQTKGEADWVLATQYELEQRAITHQNVQKILYLLQPQLVKCWLRSLPPEEVVGMSQTFCGCPLATYILRKTGLTIEVGGAFDISTFKYEDINYLLPDWAISYADFIDYDVVNYLAELLPEGEDLEKHHPNYPSVPVTAKLAFRTFEDHEEDLVRWGFENTFAAESC